MNNNIAYLFKVFGSSDGCADACLKVITSRWKSWPFQGTRSNEELTARLTFRAEFVEWRLEGYVRRPSAAWAWRRCPPTM